MILRCIDVILWESEIIFSGCMTAQSILMPHASWILGIINMEERVSVQLEASRQVLLCKLPSLTTQSGSFSTRPPPPTVSLCCLVRFATSSMRRSWTSWHPWIVFRSSSLGASAERAAGVCWRWTRSYLDEVEVLPQDLPRRLQLHAQGILGIYFWESSKRHLFFKFDLFDWVFMR